jgi:hypothetical protein
MPKGSAKQLRGRGLELVIKNCATLPILDFYPDSLLGLLRLQATILLSEL